jgi:hypothetical protein
MGAVLRTVLVVAVLVIPGAFGVLLAYFAARMLRRGYLEARQRAPGSEVRLRDVLGTLRVRMLVQEARALGF